MSRVAVIGSTGQLGSDLVVTFRHHGTTVVPLSHTDVECADSESVNAALKLARPDIVINCAAVVRVDDCEDEAEKAFSVNCLGALHVARACATLRAVCVQISTDYVFSGEKAAPYREDDRPLPTNVYGLSKLAGEEAVRAYCPDHLIVRSSGLFGSVPSRAKQNFVETMISLAHSQTRIRVVADQVVSPTYTLDLAHAVNRLLELDVRGLWHVANSGQCTWYQFAQEIFRLSGQRPDLTPTNSEDFSAKARRPRNSALDTSRFAAVTGAALRSWQEALTSYMSATGRLQVQ